MDFPGKLYKIAIDGSQMNEDKDTLAMKKKMTFEMQDAYEKIQVLNDKMSLSYP